MSMVKTMMKTVNIPDVPVITNAKKGCFNYEEGKNKKEVAF